MGALAQDLNVELELSHSGDGVWQSNHQPDWNGWSPSTRRLGVGGPEEEILYHLRGSKNEVFKLA